jgi:hypothetical protein
MDPHSAFISSFKNLHENRLKTLNSISSIVVNQDKTELLSFSSFDYFTVCTGQRTIDKKRRKKEEGRAGFDR